MDRAFRTIVTRFGGSIVEAATMCSTTPARELGLTGFGVIAVGAIADLVVLDRGFRVVRTFIGGEQVLGPGRAAQWQPAVNSLGHSRLRPLRGRHAQDDSRTRFGPGHFGSGSRVRRLQHRRARRGDRDSGGEAVHGHRRSGSESPDLRRFDSDEVVGPQRGARRDRAARAGRADRGSAGRQRDPGRQSNSSSRRLALATGSTGFTSAPGSRRP